MARQPKSMGPPKLSPRLLPNQRRIQTFTRAVKPGVTLDGSENTLSLKRKLDEREIDENGRVARSEAPNLTTLSANQSKRCAASLVPKTLANSATLRINTVRPNPSAPNPSEKVITLSPPKEDECRKSEGNIQSAASNDFISLHSSFLSALSLHFAHNGSSAPVDLKQLLPSVERIWKRRKVVTEDIQRLLYVLGESGSLLECSGGVSFTRFRLANYGPGKTCLERVDVKGQRELSLGPLNEAELGRKFSQNLERIWQRNLETCGGQETNNDLVQAIPLAPIHCSTLAFTALRKGHQRWLDLSAGSVRLRACNSEGDFAKSLALAKGSNGTLDRRKGLIERIKTKELRQSKLPPPLSKEMLALRSASERIEEVVRILILLRPLASVDVGLSYTLPQKRPYRLEIIIQNIQDSTRNPISKQEVETCLRILAEPSVAGDWVAIVTISELKSVVLRSGKDVSLRDIRMKVANLKFWK